MVKIEVFCKKCKQNFVPTEPDHQHFFQCPNCGLMNTNPGFNKYSVHRTTGYRKSHTGQRSVYGADTSC